MYGETQGGRLDPPSPDGETPANGAPGADADGETPPAEFDLGFLVGVLVGEGHFGGDGRQPQVTLRMHTRHERMFQWLQATFPGGRLYGPYHHGGRSYYQWMVRGDYLRTEIVPILAARLEPLDAHASDRFRAMCRDYSIDLPNSASTQAPGAPPSI